MRTLRSIAAALALPIVFGGFSYNPVVTEYYPGGIVVTRSLACPIFIKNGSPQTFPSPILANSTGNDVQYLIYTTVTGGLTVTTQSPSSTGNVTITQQYGTSFIPKGTAAAGPTIDVDVIFDAGAVNASNSTTMNFSGTCGVGSVTANFSIN